MPPPPSANMGWVPRGAHSHSCPSAHRQQQGPAPGTWSYGVSQDVLSFFLLSFRLFVEEMQHQWTLNDFLCEQHRFCKAEGPKQHQWWHGAMSAVYGPGGRAEVRENGLFWPCLLAFLFPIHTESRFNLSLQKGSCSPLYSLDWCGSTALCSGSKMQRMNGAQNTNKLLINIDFVGLCFFLSPVAISAVWNSWN